MHYKSGQFQGLHFVTGNPHIIIPYHARLPKLNESRPQNSDKLFPWKKKGLKTSKAGFMRVLKRIVFFTKTVLTYCDHEKCLKFEAECREFAKILRTIYSNTER